MGNQFDDVAVTLKPFQSTDLVLYSHAFAFLESNFLQSIRNVRWAENLVDITERARSDYSPLLVLCPFYLKKH